MPVRPPLLLAVLAGASCASIEDQTGWYAGASLGTAVLELERGQGDTAFAFDEEDTAWKAFGGYRWDFPHFFLGLEGGYVDLGDPPAFFPDLRVQLDAAGINVWSLAGVNVGPFGLYAKLGGIFWDIDSVATGATTEAFDEQGVDLATGFGMRVEYEAVELRAEVESYDIADTRNVQMLSLGLGWTF